MNSSDTPNRATRWLHRPLRALQRGALVAASIGAVLAVAGTAFAAWFVQAGVYDVSAVSAHTQSVYTLLEVTMRQSVRRRARDIVVPDLTGADVARRGAACYRENCLVCHGAPGIAPGAIGKGLQPLPGPLADAQRRWSPAELYWITRHGIKMSGMPAWQYRLADADLWAVVAHIGTLGDASPAEYVAAAARSGDAACDGASLAPATASTVSTASTASTASERSGPPEPAKLSESPQLPSRTAASGSAAAADASIADGAPADGPARGRIALRQFACSSCHAIPGVTGSQSALGPPLDGFARRGSIAGRLPATREQLIAFIRHPQRLKPGSAMPELGVGEAHAQDMADYLLTLR